MVALFFKQREIEVGGDVYSVFDGFSVGFLTEGGGSFVHYRSGEQEKYGIQIFFNVLHDLVDRLGGADILKRSPVHLKHSVENTEWLLGRCMFSRVPVSARVLELLNRSVSYEPLFFRGGASVRKTNIQQFLSRFSDSRYHIERSEEGRILFGGWLRMLVGVCYDLDSDFKRTKLPRFPSSLSVEDWYRGFTGSPPQAERWVETVDMDKK